jgi:hypothetical protein
VFRFWVGMRLCLSLLDVMRDLRGIYDGVSAPGPPDRGRPIDPPTVIMPTMTPG